MASNDHPPPPAKRAKILREGRLENKVVFITAAAQGIGRASALVSRRGRDSTVQSLLIDLLLNWLL